MRHMGLPQFHAKTRIGISSKGSSVLDLETYKKSINANIDKGINGKVANAQQNNNQRSRSLHRIISKNKPQKSYNASPQHKNISQFKFEKPQDRPQTARNGSSKPLQFNFQTEKIHQSYDKVNPNKRQPKPSWEQRYQTELKKELDIDTATEITYTEGMKSTSQAKEQKKPLMSFQGRSWTHYQGQNRMKRTDNNKKQKSGFGVLYFTNGDKFIGNFHKDQANGHGTYYDYTNLISIMGIWQQSKLIQNPIFSNLQPKHHKPIRIKNSSEIADQSEFF